MRREPSGPICITVLPDGQPLAVHDIPVGSWYRLDGDTIILTRRELWRYLCAAAATHGAGRRGRVVEVWFEPHRK